MLLINIADVKRTHNFQIREYTRVKLPCSTITMIYHLDQSSHLPLQGSPGFLSFTKAPPHQEHRSRFVSQHGSVEETNGKRQGTTKNTKTPALAETMPTQRKWNQDRGGEYLWIEVTTSLQYILMQAYWNRVSAASRKIYELRADGVSVLARTCHLISLPGFPRSHPLYFSLLAAPFERI